QEPAGSAAGAVAEKLTASPTTAAPVTPLVTVTVSVDVLLVVAEMVAGLADATTELGTGFCVMVMELLVPPLASKAVTTQVPAVVDAVYVVLSTPPELVAPEDG